MLPALLNAQEPCAHQLQDLLNMRTDGRLEEITAPPQADPAPPGSPLRVQRSWVEKWIGLIGVRAPALPM